MMRPRRVRRRFLARMQELFDDLRGLRSVDGDYRDRAAAGGVRIAAVVANA